VRANIIAIYSNSELRYWIMSLGCWFFYEKIASSFSNLTLFCCVTN